MGASAGRPVLCVEGLDDQHVIIHLMKRNGLDWTDQEENRPVHIKRQGGHGAVIASISDEVKAAKLGTVGFVVDIDMSAGRRWAEVVRQLRSVGANPSNAPVPGGYIEEIAALKARVGVWLMPNNTLEFGKLEHFVETLVPPDDPLLAFSQTSTANARQHGAHFTNKDELKATLHCWLAWQEQPGVPYGDAIKRKFLGSTSPTAASFVAWFRNLYQLS